MNRALALALAIGLPGAGMAEASVTRAGIEDDGQVETAAETESGLFSPDDLLWLEVRVGDHQVAESMDAYGARAGVFLPLGQFARVLDLAIGAFPAQRRAEGWVVSRDRRLVVDLDEGVARIGDKSIPIAPGQARVFGDDLYLRSDLIEYLLPVRLQVDPAAQLLRVEALETLPFQDRLARAARLRGLSAHPVAEDARRITPPYAAFTPPMVDINLGGQIARDGQDAARRFDVRLSGDLAYAGMQIYVGANDNGEVSDIRASLSRKDPDNRALGWLGGTRVGAGDVFTPSLPIGAAGFGGRGFFYSSAPLETLDIATPLNLRGELALGEEVELYVNEVLHAARSTAEQGRYEFLDVPLTYGLNTIRLVFYNAQGRSREVVRRINFGAGQVQRGQTVFRVGLVEQGVDLFSTGLEDLDPDARAVRFALQVDHGLSETLTLGGGLAVHTPMWSEQRSVRFVGLRQSLAGAALQIDAAMDDQGGQGATAAASTRVFGASILARHSEYAGGFVDETRQLGLPATRSLRRATDIRADGQWRLINGLVLPLSFEGRRLEEVSGDESMLLTGRVAAPLHGYYASSSVTWARGEGAGRPTSTLYGQTDVASLVRSGIQFRGGVSYLLSPELSAESAYAALDLDFGERYAVRLGAVRAVSTGETSVQASGLWRTRDFDISLNGGYQVESRDWRVGLQLAASFGYNPVRKAYRSLRPGAATGGAVDFDVFVDDNGDGVRQIDEEGVAGLVLETPAGAITSDGGGRGSISGLGDGARARLRIDTTGVADPFLTGGAVDLETTPRPGRAVMVSYPMRRSAEIQAVAVTMRPDGAARPLAALDLELVAGSGAVVATGRTDHAGVLFLEGIPPGEYRLQLAPSQAVILGLEVDGPLPVVVGASGGYIDSGRLVVRVAGARP